MIVLLVRCIPQVSVNHSAVRADKLPPPATKCDANTVPGANSLGCEILCVHRLDLFFRCRLGNFVMIALRATHALGPQLATAIRPRSDAHRLRGRPAPAAGQRLAIIEPREDDLDRFIDRRLWLGLRLDRRSRLRRPDARHPRSLGLGNPRGRRKRRMATLLRLSPLPFPTLRRRLCYRRPKRSCLERFPDRRRGGGDRGRGNRRARLF
jgi:hypothetical protein